MEKKLDIGKVEAALKRAAKAAVSGSREERSGRFSDAKTTQASSGSSARQGSKKEK